MKSSFPHRTTGVALSPLLISSIFAVVFDSCRLIDLRATSSSYSWYRKEVGFHKVSKRLDRALADVQWRNLFPNVYVKRLDTLEFLWASCCC